MLGQTACKTPDISGILLANQNEMLCHYQGRYWENGLEKYIVEEVYLRSQKYNLSPYKSII